MSMKRDFSRENVQKIATLILEDMKNSEGFINDWKDFFDDIVERIKSTYKIAFDIEDYLADVEAFQKDMIDNHDVDIDMFNRILQRVHGVDVKYAGIIEQERQRQESLSERINKLCGMISPKAINLSLKDYENRLNYIEQSFKEKQKDKKDKIESINKAFEEMMQEAEYENLDEFSWRRFRDEAIGTSKSLIKILYIAQCIATGSFEQMSSAEDAVDNTLMSMYDNFGVKRPSDVQMRYINKGEDVSNKATIVLALGGLMKGLGEKAFGSAESALGEEVCLNEDALKLSDDAQKMEKTIKDMEKVEAVAEGKTIGALDTRVAVFLLIQMK